jgi:integrase
MAKLLPRKNKVRKVRHQPALPFGELPNFMADLRARAGISARALELTILTAARTSEVLNAQWGEFDLDGAVWIIPGERMKVGREHRVPLSDRALAVVKDMKHEKSSPYLFPGAKAKQPLSNMAMLQVLRGMKEGLTVHGFRSSFRDWAGESTNFPRELAEAALAHTIGDKSEAAYRRGDALEKRRKLMQAWDNYCARPSAEVILLKRRAQ